MSDKPKEDDEHWEHQRDQAMEDFFLGRNEGYLSDDALRRAEKIVGMRLAESAKGILYVAASLADYLDEDENSRNSALTTAHLLLACCSDVLETVASHSLTCDLARNIPKETWLEARKLLSQQVRGNRDRLNISQFFIYPFTAPARQVFNLTTRAQQALKDAAMIAMSYYNTSELTAEHILAAITLDPSKFPQAKRLVQVLENDGGIIESLVARNLQNQTLDLTKLLEKKRSILDEGTKEKFQLESEKLAANFNEYAKAVAATLEIANNSSHCSESSNEVSFAIFGQWGSGKTSLVNKINAELKLNNIESVRFNAWKYRERPAIWAHMYLSLLSKTQQFSKKWLPHQMALRASLSRDQVAPIFWPGIILLLIALLPYVFQKPESLSINYVLILLASYAVSIFPLIGFIKFLKRAQRGFGKTLQELLSFPDHQEHLGLQATIGEDLSQLMTASTGKIPSKAYCSYIAALCFFTLALGVHLNRVRDLVQLTVQPWVYWPLCALALVGIIYLFCLVLVPIKKKPTKIHLVIDDIDRCHEDEMLEIIENIRVLLDDPVISKSLMVTMLLNRQILSNALLRRHRSLHESGVIPKAELPQTQIDKYFLLTFDIPPLKGDVLSSVVDVILDEGSERLPTEDATPARTDSSTSPSKAPTSKSSSPHASPSLAPEVKGGDSENISSTDARPDQLSFHEKSHLRLLCEEMSKSRKITPRKIRQFKLRYLFSRLLSRHLFVSSQKNYSLAEAYRDYLLKQGGIDPIDDEDKVHPASENVFYCTLGPIHSEH